MLSGGANYFCLGPVSRGFSAVDFEARRRLRRSLCDKHKEPRPTYSAEGASPPRVARAV
jgi:hypothetical protein